MKRKVLATVLAAAMVMGLGACGGSSSSTAATDTADAAAVYAFIGDLNGVQVNYPEGDGIVIKYDDVTEAEKDMVKIVGRQYAAHALTACGRFCVVAKPAAVTT